MKKILIVPLILLSIGIISCEKATVQEPQAYMQEDKAVINPEAVLFGTCDGWYISVFQKERFDLTPEYNSFKLVFCPDNTVVVSNDILSVTGNWDLIVDEEIPVKLMLNFNNPVEAGVGTGQFTFLNEIGGKWDIVQYQKNMIRLNNRESFKLMVIARGALN